MICVWLLLPYVTLFSCNSVALCCWMVVYVVCICFVIGWIGFCCFACVWLVDAYLDVDDFDFGVVLLRLFVCFMLYGSLFCLLTGVVGLICGCLLVYVVIVWYYVIVLI